MVPIDIRPITFQRWFRPKKRRLEKEVSLHNLPGVENMTSHLAVYKTFDHLVTGYSEIHDRVISQDILQLILINIANLSITTNQITAEHQNIRNANYGNEFEIFMDEFTCSLSKPIYYKMDWIYHLNERQVSSFKQAEHKQKLVDELSNENSLNLFKTFETKIIYETKHCLSFISVKFGRKCNGIYRISAIDENSSIINQTAWKLYQNEGYDQSLVPKPRISGFGFWFNEEIDIKNKGSVDVDDWLYGLLKAKVLINNNESELYLFERCFYYVVFKQMQLDLELMDKPKKVISYSQLNRFVLNRRHYDTHFIYNKIPNIILKHNNRNRDILRSLWDMTTLGGPTLSPFVMPDI